MATYNWNGSNLPAPSRTRIQQTTAAQMTQSPFTNHVYTYSRGLATLWRYSLAWDNLAGEDRVDLLSFFARLNGQEHRVTLPIFNEALRGNWAGGTLVVNGAGQTGSVISCRGAPASQSQQTRRGDWCAIGGRLRMITSGESANVSGEFDAIITPPVTVATTDGESVVPADDPSGLSGSDITGTFILLSPLDWSSEDSVNESALANSMHGNLTSLALDFIEDVTVET